MAFLVLGLGIRRARLRRGDRSAEAKTCNLEDNTFGAHAYAGVRRWRFSSLLGYCLRFSKALGAATPYARNSETALNAMAFVANTRRMQHAPVHMGREMAYGRRRA